MLDTSEEMEGLPSPDFRLERQMDATPPAVRLYLQTFARSQTNPDAWVSRPATAWHLLAVIEAHQITSHPVFTNPYAQRYLRPKHGQFDKLILERDSERPLPEDEEEAVREMSSHWRLFDEPSVGFGFVKDLDPLRYGLATLRHRRLGRREVRSANSHLVRNSLLSEMDPERFPRIVESTPSGELFHVRLDRTPRTTTSVRSARVSSVRALREDLPQIAAELPRELFELHSEIERVTLANMVERYESLLQQNLSEARWQRFFEDNLFILSMAFARPVRLLHTQFHAQGSGLDGTGAQVGDFLFAEHGPALAIVEIKKPGTELMLGSPYRNTQVFGPTAELSGAVTQVLYQQSSLRSHWILHSRRPELVNSHPDNIGCVVIAGRLPTDETRRRSFEIFRNACKDVDVITFDELLHKLRLLLSHLNAQHNARNADVTF